MVVNAENLQPTGKTPRKATSAQAEAARKNETKSHGAHDTTQTRFNGMKHGMCATAHVAVDGENQDLGDQKAAASIAELGEERDLLLTDKAADVSVNRDCMLRQRYFRENSHSFHAAMRQYRLMYELRMKYPGMGESAPETGPPAGWARTWCGWAAAPQPALLGQ